MKNQDVTIEVLEFIHKEGKATRIKVEEWLKIEGVDIEDEHVAIQISEVFDYGTGLLHCVTKRDVSSDEFAYVLKAPAHFALLNYYNYKQAQEDSKSAEKNAKRSIRWATLAFVVSTVSAGFSIWFSLHTLSTVQTVKIYEGEKTINTAQTPDNKPIIKSAPNMPKGE